MSRFGRRWALLLVIQAKSKCASSYSPLDPGFSSGRLVCGFPGSPANGSISSKHQEAYATGVEVQYRCDDGFGLFGGSSRTCISTGEWSGSLPTCRKNIAEGQTTLQSDTLWSYDSVLAVDGNISTCSFTNSNSRERWWQVHLGEPKTVETVIIWFTQGTVQKFSIFVIELLAGKKALYKPCNQYEGRIEEERLAFLCNNGEGIFGQFIYIRDDREVNEYFGMCEVEVFSSGGSHSCGLAERPLGSMIVQSDNVINYSCEEGYSLEGEPERVCEDNGAWSGPPPTCREVECADPVSPRNGYIEVSNFKGRYQYGSVATYKCNPGFILWGNSTRLCSKKGAWEGTTPVCHPITCGPPPQIPHALADLLNGSTTWRSVVLYSCQPGYINVPTAPVVTPGNSQLANGVNFPPELEAGGLMAADGMQVSTSTAAMAECGQDGIWSQPSIKCYYDPSAASRNIKKGGILHDWSIDTSNQLNLKTLLTIGILSALIVLTLIIVIIIVTHRRSASQVSSRKSSHSSINQLIVNPLDTDGDNFKEKQVGIILYDDLNNPHVVETDHNQIFNQTTPSPSMAEQINENEHLEQAELRNQRVGSGSPGSLRSSGDGGSERGAQPPIQPDIGLLTGLKIPINPPDVCNHERVVGEPPMDRDPDSLEDEDEDGGDGHHYEALRQPDGRPLEDPYASMRVRKSRKKRFQLNERKPESADDEHVYSTLRRGSSEVSCSTSGSQDTVLAVQTPDSQALYASIDLHKKAKSRGGSVTGSPRLVQHRPPPSLAPNSFSTLGRPAHRMQFKNGGPDRVGRTQSIADQVGHPIGDETSGRLARLMGNATLPRGGLTVLNSQFNASNAPQTFETVRPSTIQRLVEAQKSEASQDNNLINSIRHEWPADPNM